MRRPTCALVSLLVSLFVTACGTADAPPAGPLAPTGAVTWHQDVAPIVGERCAGCHHEGGVGPFSLTDYAAAAPMASAMAGAVEAGLMPPWSAAPSADCAPVREFEDDPSLSPEEIALLRAWVDGGAPEGDPGTAAALLPAPSRDLVGATHHLEMPAPWVASGTQDEFPCYVLDPGLTEDAWLTGVQVVPGNEAAVHHVVVTLDVDGSAALEAGPDGSVECFGGVGDMVGGFTPGAPPFELPEGIAMHVPAGAVFVLNLHYHPLASTEPDRTALHLRLADAPPLQTAAFFRFGNAEAPPELQAGPNDATGVEFRVPALMAGHTETMRYVIPGEADARVPLWSVFPHMHYLGVAMEVHLERATPAAGEPVEECLISVPRYSFGEQRLYRYRMPIDQLPTAGGGDVLTLRCTYDNTPANPFLNMALAEQGLPAPVDVGLGEGTLDEMCIGLFGALLPAAP